MSSTKFSSLHDIVSNRLCTGCGTCALLAPTHVKMAETADENRRPAIATDLPPSLDKFLAGACPSVGNRDADTSSPVAQAWGPVLEVWEGYAADEEIRFKGSSGGAVTALSLAAMQFAGFAGALHVKASLTNPKLNEARMSNSRDELMEGAGSRYAPASVADRLDLVADAEGACVVIGKPCDITAVKAIGELRVDVARNIGLTISIFCAGTPSHAGTDALLKHLGKPENTDLKSMRYRGNGWPGEMTARWIDGDKPRVASTSYADGWGNILQAHRQWRCMTCADHTGEVADLSVGDPWQTPTEEGGHGKSLIIVRTERGRAMLRRAVAAGFLNLAPRSPKVLFDAQPNLVATKGAVWGRRLMQRLSGRKAVPMREDSFRAWLDLPFRAKAQSTLGTLKRIVKRKFYLKKQTVWLDAEGRN
ncbi:MAG: Coenzyme F420 hydrogenase/dehydrogenase, beta subunit C-terminal domain [Kordiimonadaceae bacterium]|nr:Coenzyme F420 hydrogenase/dehydrogenase, beta subunit C-terminal domain [Kordiimonadaceae bacterium]MBO6570766.1 Coenzyme F420 hydrogenase/dehydrogenase, beta subunit C-terminal domain [Kordiimonadaceae bacterium]MBO6965447.1 Coenzyme F420 hydrogenase/dehydrogenase, beta subunit C-terminal domain [Kordiimonadaceae bacterium]